MISNQIKKLEIWVFLHRISGRKKEGISESISSFLVLRVESKFGTEHSPEQPKHWRLRRQASTAGGLRSQCLPAGTCLVGFSQGGGPCESQRLWRENPLMGRAEACLRPSASRGLGGADGRSRSCWVPLLDPRVSVSPGLSLRQSLSPQGRPLEGWIQEGDGSDC